MFQRLFQRAAGKTNGSREASRPLPVAIPVPPSPPREPTPPPTPFEGASSQRLAPPPMPLAAAGDVDWQPLPGGDAVGTGRVSVSPGPAQPFPGWQGWEGPASAADEPCDGEEGGDPATIIDESVADEDVVHGCFGLSTGYRRWTTDYGRRL